MRTSELAIVVSLTWFAAGCTGNGETPQSVGEAVSDALADAQLAELSPETRAIGRELYQPADARPMVEVDAAACAAVGDAIGRVCGVRGEPGGTHGDTTYYTCNATAVFFLAHDVPRCAGRITLGEAEPFAPIYSFDVSGEPTSTPNTCGNGILDEGEECDDGNTEMWDGCDPSCYFEGFEGCEVIIESYFANAELAWVDRDDWESPRTHVMVHGKALALDAVTEQTCNAAAATADDVCRELVNAMPFVGRCASSVAFDAGDRACAVRLTVDFVATDPGSGVFTTELPGILSFTIR